MQQKAALTGPQTAHGPARDRPAQRSFDQVGTPLREVTFVVVDLETTGASPNSCAVTEIGAVKLRGGETLGTFHTLVNPGMAIPPEIVYLTGITESMVGPAPELGPVLASFMEFLGGSVLVGHNVRFDVGFLDAERLRRGQPRLENVVIDTCRLARRLVRDEVRDCKLATLARHFRLAHQPSHRALDDALATGELLHCLLERASTFGVLGLGDLVELNSMGGHPQAGKLRLTTALPRRPGVYLFKDGAGNVIYVGKAANLRQRVRSYFSTDDRRKVGGLLRQTAAIEHFECGGALEALAAEARLIGHLRPRFNGQAKGWERYAYVKLTLTERFPRLSVVRRPRPDDGCLYLGPVGSVRTARLLVEAIETAVPVRRCRGPVRSRPATTSGATPVGRPRQPCPTRALGLRTCVCEGSVSEEDYAPAVDAVVRGLTVDPAALLGPLGERMRRLADAGRFEEAADVRDRGAALARALIRQRRIDALRSAGRVVIALDDDTQAVLVDGRLLGASRPGHALPLSGLSAAGTAWGSLASRLGPSEADRRSWPAPLDRHLADEAAAVASWLESNWSRVRVLEADHGWSFPARPVFDFCPVPRPAVAIT